MFEHFATIKLHRRNILPTSIKKERRKDQGENCLTSKKLSIMASSRMFMIIAIVAVFLPSILATEHVVGDKTGWRPGFDYKTWAQGKTFYVGDTLGNSTPSK